MKSAQLGCLLLAAVCAAPASAATQSDKDSVFSWGRWETLNPAAGGLPDPTPQLSVQGVNLRPEDSQQLTPQIQTTGGGGGGTPPAGPPSVPGVVPVDPNQPIGSGPPSPPPPPPGVPGVVPVNPNQPIGSGPPSPPPPPGAPL